MVSVFSVIDFQLSFPVASVAHQSFFLSLSLRLFSLSLIVGFVSEDSDCVRSVVCAAFNDSFLH